MQRNLERDAAITQKYSPGKFNDIYAKAESTSPVDRTRIEQKYHSQNAVRDDVETEIQKRLEYIRAREAEIAELQKSIKPDQPMQ